MRNGSRRGWCPPPGLTCLSICLRSWFPPYILLGHMIIAEADNRLTWQPQALGRLACRPHPHQVPLEQTAAAGTAGSQFGARARGMALHLFRV